MRDRCLAATKQGRWIFQCAQTPVKDGLCTLHNNRLVKGKIVVLFKDVNAPNKRNE